MKSQQNNNLIVFAMVALAILVSAADSAAQNRLVKFKPPTGEVCIPEMWYDLDDPMPKNWEELGRDWLSYFYSNENIRVRYLRDSAMIAEFRQLVVDSALIEAEREEFLLDSNVRDLIAVLRDSLGIVRIKAIGVHLFVRANERYTGKDEFSIDLEFDNFYNVFSMYEWMRQLRLSSLDSNGRNPMAQGQSVGCVRLATSVHEDSQQKSDVQVTSGRFDVGQITGPYIVVDVRGSTIAQGVGDL